MPNTGVGSTILSFSGDYSNEQKQIAGLMLPNILIGETDKSKTLGKCF